MKNISVLGSTGSIGKNTLEIAGRFPDRFRVVGLAAKNNIQLLETQIKEFKPEVVAVFDEAAGMELKKKNLSVEVLTGDKGLVDVATLGSAEVVVSAIVGSAGLLPTFSAVEAGKDLALATKECLVMAGSVIMAEASKKQVTVIPVDSEHSAVFQCLGGRQEAEIKKVILTASGGAFINKDVTELESVTPEQALKHPNWTMGRKVTIDSATLMNKGLEVIEARWLFDLPVEKIDVLLHPQSIVHSMVEFIDGSVIAQMSVPDMKGPISYALSYPERFENILPSLDLSDIRELTFDKPDSNKYPCLALAYDALRKGGTMPCVMNAANEVAVDAFLDKKISFIQIPVVVSDTMRGHKVSEGGTIDEIIGVSDLAKQKAGRVVEELKKITIDD